MGILFALEAAQAEGFMVLPMRMEVEARVGEVLEFPLEIRNTVGERPRNIDVRLVELSQAPDGAWQVLEPAGEIAQNPHSSLPWTTLNEDRLEIAPMHWATVMVQVRPPAAARGVYFAGILAEGLVSDNATGIAIRARFLVPLIVQIQGRPARKRVALDDVAMTYEAPDGAVSTTTARLIVANRGQTFSRVRGQLQIERQTEDKWRLVTRVELPERAILPGLTLSLSDDLERRLPSGTYRLRGELFVDGRRVAPVEKEILFVGDSNTNSIAYDTALVLTPALVDMNVSPGATRTTVVQVENTGTDPVGVQFKTATPSALAGVDIAGRKGTALSAEPWIEVRPAEVMIRPGGRQSVRVIARIPREGLDHPNYYADLILKGQYSDGQSAGTTRSTIHLVNPKVESTPDGMIEQVSIAEIDDPGEYVLQMRFANLGNTHLEPSVISALTTPQGSLVKSATLAGEEGSLLPFGKRTYSGKMSFADVVPGHYALRITAKTADGREFAHQEVVLVEVEEAVGAKGVKVSAPTAMIVDPVLGKVPEGLIPATEPPLPDDGAEWAETGKKG
jgi:hypothetical protein